MTLGDLIEKFGDGADALKLFVGWHEVVDAQVREDMPYPYIELIREEDPSLGEGE